MKKISLKLLILILALIPTKGFAAALVEMHDPIPLQVLDVQPEDVNVYTIFAEDIVSILHPLIDASDKNFKPSDANTVEIDGIEFSVGDFALTPAPFPVLRPSTPTPILELVNPAFLSESAVVSDVKVSDLKEPPYGGIYIADVRNSMAGEDPLVPPVIFLDGYITPYKDPKPFILSQRPAFSIAKLQGSEDIVVVVYVSVKYTKEDDTTFTLSSPIFYLKRMEEGPDVGLYRLEGAIGRSTESLVKNEYAVDIEALNIDHDAQGYDDLAILNRPSDHEPGYVIFLTSIAQEWASLVDAFSWPGMRQEVGIAPYDSAVGSDKDPISGKWKDFLMVPSFDPDENGEYPAYKFTSELDKQKLYLGAPTFIQENCEADERCGPVRIECSRYAKDSAASIFDINNDGCSDCVITWAKLSTDEDNDSYFELFNKFTLYLSHSKDGVCSYDLRERTISRWLPAANLNIEQDKVSPQIQAFAIEIANLNPTEDDFLDIAIGDQALYPNFDTEDFDSFVYIFRGKIEENEWELLDTTDNVSVIDANYQAKDNYYVEGKPGGGVKAIVADRFGNLGVINGYPFIPYGPREPLEECDGYQEVHWNKITGCEYTVPQYPGGDNDVDNDCIPDCIIIQIDDETVARPCDDVNDNTGEPFVCEEPGAELGRGDHLFKIASYISDLITTSAHAQDEEEVEERPEEEGVDKVDAKEQVTGVKSEAPVLINKGIREEEPPPPTPETTLNCIVDVDREWKTTEDLDKEEGPRREYKGFRVAIRELNDKCREITGLPIDCFLGEYVTNFSVRLVSPFNNVWHGAQNFLHEIFLNSGPKPQIYHDMSERPVYLTNRVTPGEPVRIIPTAQIESDMNISLPAVGTSIGDEEVQPQGNSEYAIKSYIDKVKFSVPEGGLYKVISANQAVASPLTVSITGVAPFIPCSWGVGACDPTYPTQLNHERFLKNLEAVVEEWEEQGKVISHKVIEEALERNRWDSTHYAEIILSLLPPESVPAAQKEYVHYGAGITFPQIVPGSYTPEEEALMTSMEASYNKGTMCHYAILLLTDMRVEIGGALLTPCSCDMNKAMPTNTDFIGGLIIAGFMALLYLRKRRLSQK